MSLILNGDTGISAVDGTASVPALVGNDTNTGIYFPAADTIGFSEGGVQVGEFDSSANFKFNSGYGSVATAYGCRAWVNFNGTGTPAIRNDGNVTSITDNGTGDYTINFTTAMPDVNYAFNINIEYNNATFSTGVGTAGARLSGIAAGSLRMQSGTLGGTATDYANIAVSIFR